MCILKERSFSRAFLAHDCPLSVFSIYQLQFVNNRHRRRFVRAEKGKNKRMNNSKKKSSSREKFKNRSSQNGAIKNKTIKRNLTTTACAH